MMQGGFHPSMQQMQHMQQLQPTSTAPPTAVSTCPPGMQLVWAGGHGMSQLPPGWQVAHSGLMDVAPQSGASFAPAAPPTSQQVAQAQQLQSMVANMPAEEQQRYHLLQQQQHALQQHLQQQHALQQLQQQQQAMQQAMQRQTPSPSGAPPPDAATAGATWTTK
jgi:DNA-binding protein H-NS